MTINADPVAAGLPAGRHRVHAWLGRATVLALIAVLATSVWSLASGALGLVTVHGASMTPTLHDGDLVLVRRAETYHVGDVVAFRSAEMGVVVVHRIIDRDADGFVLQGDGNTWIDLDRPRAADIVGRIAVGIPRGGALLTVIRHPLVLAGLGLAFGLTFAVRRDEEGDDAPDG